MRLEQWLHPQRQVLLAVVVVAAVSAGALGWLAWMLVRQDAELERQRQTDRAQQAADRAAASMRLAFADLSARAARAEAHPMSADAGLLRVEMGASYVTVPAGAGLLFVPRPGTVAEAPAEAFGVAERMEFAGDLSAALVAYRRSTRGGRAAWVGPALVRVARVQRKLGRPDAAMLAYDQLAALDATPVDGLPAGLVARVGRASVLEASGRLEPLRAEAAVLRNGLLAGRWPLTRAQFLFYRDQAAAWLGTPVHPPAHDLVKAEALDWAWGHVRTAQEPGLQALRLANGPALVAWSPSSGGVRVIVADGRYLAAACADGALRLRCAVHDGAGQWLAGDRPVDGPSARLVADTSGATWNVHVAASVAGTPAGSPRRTLLVTTVAMAGLVLAAGWYFILRGMARERAALRVQADFVAAVSHEFRSPLTSMSHVAEMLQSGRIATDDSKARAYDVLVHDTERLRTLVEQLLEFGRFEAGGPVLRLERLDVADAVRIIVADFQARVAADGYRVEYDGPATPIWVHADREAIAMALWNLMDNAAKYSPDATTIWVRLREDGANVSLAVRDEGLGIPLAEQATVFAQFVRGAEPKARRIRGTGIGLALVRHIARAHGGDVTLSSEPGKGSTFTLRIRTMKDA